MGLSIHKPGECVCREQSRISILIRHMYQSHLSFLLRPPLSKKLFTVDRMGKNKDSREVGNLFLFFPNFIFYKLECTGGGGGSKKNFFFENRKKKVPVGSL